jgi:hypothetical protein
MRMKQNGLRSKGLILLLSMLLLHQGNVATVINYAVSPNAVVLLQLLDDVAASLGGATNREKQTEDHLPVSVPEPQEADTEEDNKEEEVENYLTIDATPLLFFYNASWRSYYNHYNIVSLLSICTPPPE